MKANIIKLVSGALCLIALSTLVGFGCGENHQSSPLSSDGQSSGLTAEMTQEYSQSPSQNSHNSQVTAASSGSCGIVRVDARNSTGYDGVLVEVVGQGIRKRLNKDEWLMDYALSDSKVTIRATYLNYSTTQTFTANGNCNVRVRIVRLSPGIIRIEQIVAQT